MNPHPDRTTPARVLAPVEFDLTDDQAPAAAFGKTVAPVTVLPATAFELEPPLAVPWLELTLHLRPEVDPGELTLDVLRLLHALNRYDRDLGGAGMNWDEARSRATAGVVRLVVTPNDGQRAEERLARLAAVVTGTDTAPLAVLAESRNGVRWFVKWEAAVLGPAA